jgi:hypothetical protein
MKLADKHMVGMTTKETKVWWTTRLWLYYPQPMIDWESRNPDLVIIVVIELPESRETAIGNHSRWQIDIDNSSAAINGEILPIYGAWGIWLIIVAHLRDDGLYTGYLLMA